MSEWQLIPGCGENYKVSNNGEIYSIPRRGSSGGILKPHTDKWGYLFVLLRVNGKNKYAYIHRLVASAFIPNPKGKPQVNHINGNKTDNRAENLEWVTDSENKKHAYATGLRKSLKGRKFKCQER